MAVIISLIKFLVFIILLYLSFVLIRKSIYILMLTEKQYYDEIDKQLKKHPELYVNVTKEQFRYASIYSYFIFGIIFFICSAKVIF